MSRHLTNWLDGYLELMENTEPARVFDRWVGFSVIAAALRRKVNLQLGRLTYYPNIYVVLVAEPGVARKTQAIKYGMNFLTTIPDIILSADSATKEAMTDDIELAALDELAADGTMLRHSSLNIVSKELESFLGQKKENTRMLVALTDLFDCPDEWASRTRHSSSTKIIRPWLNFLAATTPDSLASSLPASAVGGGLTSRIMFIWAEKKKKSVAIPIMTPEDYKLKEKLEKDLYQMSRISGEYFMSEHCVNNWVDWYNNYDEDEAGERLCSDKSFDGWYSRKPSYIIKIALLCAAAESNTMVMQWSHIEKAIAEIKGVENIMGNAFKAIGKSDISAEVSNVLQIVRNYGWISEKQLMTIVWRDLDSSKFDNVMDTLIKTGTVKRTYKGPKDEKGIWYGAVNQG